MRRFGFLSLCLLVGCLEHDELTEIESAASGGDHGNTPTLTGTNVNVASSSALDQLPYVSASLANAIVFDRHVHGAFFDDDDLLRVDEMTTSILDQIRGYTTAGRSCDTNLDCSSGEVCVGTASQAVCVPPAACSGSTLTCLYGFACTTACNLLANVTSASVWTDRSQYFENHFPGSGNTSPSIAISARLRSTTTDALVSFASYSYVDVQVFNPAGTRVYLNPKITTPPPVGGLDRAISTAGQLVTITIQLPYGSPQGQYTVRSRWLVNGERPLNSATFQYTWAY